MSSVNRLHIPLGVLFAAMVLACAGQPHVPRPGTGAATPADLAAAYADLHRRKDSGPLRDLEFRLAQLDGRALDDIAAHRQDLWACLFRLDLNDARVVGIPPGCERGDLGECGPQYVRPAPGGGCQFEVFLDHLDDDESTWGKLLLTGRLPDGRPVDVDPGLAVVSHRGRFYLREEWGVFADAAGAVCEGRSPVFRPIPLGVDFRGRGPMTWDEAVRRLDAPAPAWPGQPAGNHQ